MKKVMFFMLTLYLAIFLFIVIGRFLKTPGIIIMLIVLLLMVIPLIINEILLYTNSRKALLMASDYNKLSQTLKLSNWVLKNKFHNKYHVLNAHLAICYYHLLTGNLDEYQRLIEGYKVEEMKSVEQVLLFTYMKKDYYWIINDKEKYDHVIEYIKETHDKLLPDLKSDIDATYFMFDLKSGYLDYKKQDEVMAFLESIKDLNKINLLSYTYTCMLIKRLKHEDYSLEKQFIIDNCQNTFFTTLIADYR